jgi:hypothetical protein
VKREFLEEHRQCALTLSRTKFLAATLTHFNNELLGFSLFIDFKTVYISLRMEVLYNSLIEFGFPMKLVRVIKVCLNATYSRVLVCKNLSDMLPIRNGLK